LASASQFLPTRKSPGWRSPRSKATAPSKPGEFEFWEGRIAGELRPTEKIPDIDKAPKNANGLVEYSAKISLIFPKNPKSGNGVLLVDIPNRGRPYALRHLQTCVLSKKQDSRSSIG
jgi:hypothetical protein